MKTKHWLDDEKSETTCLSLSSPTPTKERRRSSKKKVNMIKFYCSESTALLQLENCFWFSAQANDFFLFATQFDSRFYFGHKTAKKATNDFVNASNDDEPLDDHDERWWLCFFFFLKSHLCIYLFCTDDARCQLACSRRVVIVVASPREFFSLAHEENAQFTWYARHLKEQSTSASVDVRRRGKEKNDRWTALAFCYESNTQCNVWCIAFMDHVKVDVKSMRSSVRWLSSGIIKRVFLPFFPSRMVDTIVHWTTKANAMICWIFSHFHWHSASFTKASFFSSIIPFDFLSLFVCAPSHRHEQAHSSVEENFTQKRARWCSERVEEGSCDWIKFRLCNFLQYENSRSPPRCSNARESVCVCVYMSAIWHRSAVDWVARKMLKESAGDDDEKFSWSSSSMLSEVHVFAIWREFIAIVMRVHSNRGVSLMISKASTRIHRMQSNQILYWTPVWEARRTEHTKNFHMQIACGSSWEMCNWADSTQRSRSYCAVEEKKMQSSIF